MFPFLALSLALAAAVVIDVRTRRIPNWLTGGLAAGGFGLAFGGGSVTPWQALLGLALGLALMLPGHVIGATGAGDVKLMAAVGAFLGPGRRPDGPGDCRAPRRARRDRPRHGTPGDGAVHARRDRRARPS
jgi:prepilin signal peptidase PulO-like enzyme (type II secretory pathway)